ncbi:MAG: ExbD/TolR family protein [Flavobacteriales bacterium]|jgi:biopolymer transport protein ExbD
MNLGQRNKISVSGNMSSMTDLVFLLLIFFIILSTLVSNGVNVELPKSKGTTSVTAKMTLSIKPDGSYHLNGGPVAYEDLESLLRIRMADATEPVLYLQVDESVPTGKTVEVIGMAKANEWKVMLGATPKN